MRSEWGVGKETGIKGYLLALIITFQGCNIHISAGLAYFFSNFMKPQS
jgi:hypothetical protein